MAPDATANIDLRYAAPRAQRKIKLSRHRTCAYRVGQFYCNWGQGSERVRQGAGADRGAGGRCLAANVRFAPIADIPSLTSDPDPLEQAWAWFGLAVFDYSAGWNGRAVVFDVNTSIAQNPDIPVASLQLGRAEYYLGHTEAVLAA